MYLGAKNKYTNFPTRRLHDSNFPNFRVYCTQFSHLDWYRYFSQLGLLVQGNKISRFQYFDPWKFQAQGHLTPGFQKLLKSLHKYEITASYLEDWWWNLGIILVEIVHVWKCLNIKQVVVHDLIAFYWRVTKLCHE